MKELKKFELNNNVLKDFDSLMTCHLDLVEELDISEILLNSKLYNIISLCTNLKTLSIKGDLRIDVNKIMFNICKPEKLETLILNSVKLPTLKAFSKFTGLTTISLNNITFSDLNGFFNKIENKDKIIALNLTNVDFGKRPISICSCFPKIKYLNLNGLKNCKFDTFAFLYENKKIERFEFYNNVISFDNINSFLKGSYAKNIEVGLTTSRDCDIWNSLEISDVGNVSITVNTLDLESLIDSVSLYKIDKLFVILENNAKLGDYIRKFKKVKEQVTLAIKDIAYLDIETAEDFQNKLNLDYISVLDPISNSNINNVKQCYSVKKYIKLRKCFDGLVEKFQDLPTEFEKFNAIYKYLRETINYYDNDTGIYEAMIELDGSHNSYATIVKSLCIGLGIECKIISGSAEGQIERLWNQVKIDGVWFNVDIATESKAKKDKNFKYILKSNLLTDESFYKNHIPKTGNPEYCYTELSKIKKNIKKVKLIDKVIYKLKGIFKFNKKQALPSPDDNKNE